MLIFFAVVPPGGMAAILPGAVMILAMFAASLAL
jgi:hypothetical protein